MKITFKIISLLFLISCQPNKIEPECFLIQEGVTGEVTIFYDDANGQEKTYIENRRVYRIGATRELYTKFSFETGLIDQIYYYVDTKGGKRQILLDSSQIYYSQAIAKNRFMKIHGKDTLIMTFGITGQTGKQNFQQFVIGTYETNNSSDSTIRQ